MEYAKNLHRFYFINQDGFMLVHHDQSDTPKCTDLIATVIYDCCSSLIIATPNKPEMGGMAPRYLGVWCVVYVCVCMCGCVYHMCVDTHRSQTRAPGSMEQSSRWLLANRCGC